jgi:hypothetical protein
MDTLSRRPSDGPEYMFGLVLRAWFDPAHLSGKKDIIGKMHRKPGCCVGMADSSFCNCCLHKHFELQIRCAFVLKIFKSHCVTDADVWPESASWRVPIGSNLISARGQCPSFRSVIHQTKPSLPSWEMWARGGTRDSHLHDHRCACPRLAVHIQLEDLLRSARLTWYIDSIAISCDVPGGMHYTMILNKLYYDSQQAMRVNG